MTAVEAWAIKAPDKRIELRTISLSKEDTVAFFKAQFLGKTLWENFERKGYRCVRVRVEEMSEE